MTLGPIGYSLLANAVMAIGLIGGAAAAHLHAKGLKADVLAAETERDDAKRAVFTLQGNATEAATQHGITKDSLERVIAELATCQVAKEKNADENRAAAQRIKADLADANATLAEIAGRYKQAMRDPSCSICLNQPICPRLVE